MTCSADGMRSPALQSITKSTPSICHCIMSMRDAIQAHVEKIVTLATGSQPVLQRPPMKLFQCPRPRTLELSRKSLFAFQYIHSHRISEVLTLTPENFDGGFCTVQRLKGSLKTIQPLVTHEEPLLPGIGPNDTTISVNFPWPVSRISPE